MFIISVILANLLTTPYACPAQMTLNASTMGPLSIGQNIAVATQNYKYRSEKFEDDGEGGTRYTVAICGSADIVVETFGRETTIAWLTTTSPIFVTDKGAHVGLSVQELKKLYPNGRLFLQNKEGGWASFVTKEGISFSLDQSVIPHRCYEHGVNCDDRLQAMKSVDAVISK